jgi:hypothetical protein
VETTAGRAARTTTSLVVILVGAGLVLVVFYSMGTELFASNSPTNVFGHASDLVRNNREVNSILRGPLKFHGDASSSRMRRNRQINSRIVVDPSTGEEKMILHFFVEGKGKEDDAAHQSWWTRAKRAIYPIVFEPSGGPSYPPPPEPAPSEQPETKEQSWFEYLFGALLPSTYRRTPNAPVFARPVKPELGKYTTGEVVATLTKVSVNLILSVRLDY